MLAVTGHGFGTLPLMSVRVSLKLRHWPFASPTVTVSLVKHQGIVNHTNRFIDANAFKEAFIRAQQENEHLFN